MRLIQAILLGLGSFLWKGIQTVLGLFSDGAARWAGRRRVGCLARMLVAGTGWGGDDAAIQLLNAVPEARGLLEESIALRRNRGKETATLEFALRLVGLP